MYRTRQFVAALRPKVSDEEYAEARALLGPNLIRLFDSMSPRDRRHCFDVYRDLASNGVDDSELLSAALLHDSGKGTMSGTTVRLWHRVAYVLLASASPALLRRMSNGRSGLSILRLHAEIGGLLAQGMGASERIVRIVEEHEYRHHENEGQRKLRTADDRF
jgi:hypothetical protein